MRKEKEAIIRKASGNYVSSMSPGGSKFDRSSPSNNFSKMVSVTVTVTKGSKQTSDGRDNVQMEEVSKGKEDVDDAALTSLLKPQQPGEKKRRITKIQKLEIIGGEHKISRTEKGTTNEQRRKDNGSLDEGEQSRLEKGSPVVEQRKTRGQTTKQKQSSNHVVVAIDRKEDKMGAHQEKSTSKVKGPNALHIWCFPKLHE
jgi:hypothetical protein